MKNNLLVVVLIATIGFFSSCVPLSRVAYVQSDQRNPEMVFTGSAVDNIIRQGDELYVRISSADEGPTSLSNEARANIYDPSLMSYTVNEDGYLKLPYVGFIHVANLTLEQAVDSVESALTQYLFFPTVYIRFINTKVTVLGEVNTPGVYLFNYKNINILQAIGYASDMTEFANRKNVLLIREEGGVRSKHYLDLTSDQLLTSNLYLIKSDDIIYVEPLGRKKWDMNKVPYNLMLSVISTAFLVITFINTK